MKHAACHPTIALALFLLIGASPASAQGPSAGLDVGSGPFEFSSPKETIAPSFALQRSGAMAQRSFQAGWRGTFTARHLYPRRYDRPGAQLYPFARGMSGSSGTGTILQTPENRFAFLQQGLSAGDGAGEWQRRLAIMQGSYYFATGLWPILSMGTFEKVTGPKTDDWLVKTVGALIAVTGGTLLVSGLGNGPSNDLQLLAAGNAAALAVVDVTYVARGRISRIYLLDAVLELALLAGWMLL